jgi:hypothetical protein
MAKEEGRAFILILAGNNERRGNQRSRQLVEEREQQRGVQNVVN